MISATPEKHNSLKIYTPEGVSFSLLLAGPVTRFLGWITDFFCIMVINSILSNLIIFISVFSQDAYHGLVILLYFVTSIFYAILFEWFWNGQTIGKKLLNLRVMDVQGLELSFYQIVIRNLLRFVDLLPARYCVGGVSCFFTKKAQRLGDLAANTVVIRTVPVASPDLKQVLTDKFNSFRSYPHLCARLRQKIAPSDADIALNALLRRSTLEPEARVKLFKSIADHFKTIVAFPQEATDGLSDENYIRNCVDILFRTN